MSSPSSNTDAEKPQPAANKGKPSYVSSSGNMLAT